MSRTQIPRERIRLGEVLAIKHGFAFKGEHFSHAGEHVLLTPGHFQERGGIKSRGDQEKYYTADYPPEFLLSHGDLVVVMTDLKQDAPILGSPGFIPADGLFLHNQRIGKIIDLDQQRIDRRFLYYLLSAESTRAQIRATATGSTVRHTAPSRIYDVIVDLLPMQTQRLVGAVLSTYDQLIKNNARRVQILEQMTRAIYREWFVEFKYPGHDGAPLVDSEIGPIPAGWAVSTVGSASNVVTRGISPKYDDNSESMVINQKCIRGGRLSLAQARRHKSTVPAEKVVRFGDVLINSTGVGTLGRVAQVYEELVDFTVDSHVTIARPNPSLVSIDYFGIAMMARESEFESMGAGSTGQTELSRARVSDVRLLIPDGLVQRQFAESAESMRSLSIKLAAQNRALSLTRDLLLPRLVSGEVDVSDLYIDLEDVSG